MEVIIFEKEAYYRMLDEVTKTVVNCIKETQKQPAKTASPDRWVKSEKAMEILNCGKDKLKAIREKPNEIIFSRDGRVYKYNEQSLLAYLDRHIEN